MHNSHSNCTADPGIPWKVKEEISQAFIMIQQSNEELVMLKADMLSTIAYWFERRTSIASKLDELKCLRENPYLRGAKCLLNRMVLEAELHYRKAAAMFSQFIELPEAARLNTGMIAEVVPSDYSDSESEEESEQTEEE